VRSQHLLTMRSEAGSSRLGVGRVVHMLAVLEDCVDTTAKLPEPVATVGPPAPDVAPRAGKASKKATPSEKPATSEPPAKVARQASKGSGKRGGESMIHASRKKWIAPSRTASPSSPISASSPPSAASG
jgi:hypothetical protein